jgi:hypothetical protein
VAVTGQVVHHRPRSLGSDEKSNVTHVGSGILPLSTSLTIKDDLWLDYPEYAFQASRSTSFSAATTVRLVSAQTRTLPHMRTAGRVRQAIRRCDTCVGIHDKPRTPARYAGDW